MVNLRASKLGVGEGRAPRAPPWIRTCTARGIFMKHLNQYYVLEYLRNPVISDKAEIQ